MDATRLLVLLLLYAVVSVSVSGSEESGDEEGDEAETAIAFRDHMRTLRGETSFDAGLERVCRLTGVDIRKDSVIQDLVRAIKDIPVENRTLEEIGRASGYEPVRLAYGISWLQTFLDEEEWRNIDEYEYAYVFVEVYYGTSFPNFPVAVAEDEFYTWGELPDYMLADVFPHMAGVDPETGEKTIPREKLNRLLAGSHSMEEFVGGGLRDDATAEEVAAGVRQVMGAKKKIFDTYHTGQANANRCYAMKHRLWSLKLNRMGRGGVCPSRCGLLTELAVETYLLAVQLDPSLEASIRETGFLKGVNSTVEELTAYFCDIFENTKEPSDFYQLLSQDWIYSSKMSYRELAMDSMLALMEPTIEMRKLLQTLSFLRLAEKTNFPSFPLEISVEESANMASVMLEISAVDNVTNEMVQTLARGLQDFRSVTRLRRVLPKNVHVNTFVRLAATLKGHVDDYRKLYVSRLELLYHLEQCGFFMMSR